jgi:hypothetical protein
MEKFRIAQYGFIQMVALAYGILSAGAMVKISKQTWQSAHWELPPVFRVLSFYRDYGLLLSVLIVGWASFCAFHSTTFSKRNFGEDKIAASGLIVTGIFFVLGTFMLIAGIANVFPPAEAYR